MNRNRNGAPERNLLNEEVTEWRPRFCGHCESSAWAVTSTLGCSYSWDHARGPSSAGKGPGGQGGPGPQPRWQVLESGPGGWAKAWRESDWKQLDGGEYGTWLWP